MAEEDNTDVVWYHYSGQIALLVTLQIGLLYFGSYCHLFEINPHDLLWLLLYQVMIQSAFTLQAKFNWFTHTLANSEYHLLLFLQLFLSGCGMLWASFLAQSYTQELASFCLALFFIGQNAIRNSSKIVLGITIVFGFLLISIDRTGPDLSKPFLLSELALPLWTWLSFTLLTTLACTISIHTDTLLKLLYSKSHQLNDALRLINHMTVRDELTGLHNQRYMIEILQGQKSLSDRGDYDFVVTLFTIDKFDELKNEHSEMAANEVLQMVGKTLNGHIRNIDYCARWDNHRFLLLLINTTVDKSKVVIERMRYSVEERSFFSLGIEDSITVSAGMTQYACIESWEQLVNRAEEALSKATQRGVNQMASLLSTTRRVELVRDIANKFKPI